MSSVLKNNRKIAPPEFVHTARELLLFTYRRSGHFPKRYTFTIGVPLVKSAEALYESVSTANQLRTDQMHSIELRMHKMETAKTILGTYVGRISIAKELFGISDALMEQWMELVDKEDRLIRGVISSDRRQHEKLRVESMQTRPSLR